MKPLPSLSLRAVWFALLALLVACGGSSEPERPDPPTPPDPDETELSLDRCGTALFFGDDPALDNYYVVLSDTQTDFVDQMCRPVAAGTALYLDLYNVKPAAGGPIRLPEGIYKMALDPRAGCCLMEYTFALLCDEAGHDEPVNFGVGTVEVTHLGEGYRILALFTDDSGKERRYRYEGDLLFEDRTQRDDPGGVLAEDLELVLTCCVGRHYRDALNPAADIVVLSLSDAALDGEGKLTRPGTLITLQLCTDPVSDPTSPILLSGRYDVAEGYEPGTLAAGVDRGNYIDGSFCVKVVSEQEMAFGLFARGGVEVTEEGILDSRIVIEAVTPEGISIRGVYTGPVELIADDPGPVDPDENLSRLTGDYAVTLSADKGRAEYLGDCYFVGADLWRIAIAGAEGDGMMFEFFAEPGDGTHLPAALYTPTNLYEAATFMPGTLSFDGQPEGTWLTGGESGKRLPLAPAMDGRVEVSVGEGGLYTFRFELLDGSWPEQHTFFGSWTGALRIENNAFFCARGR